MEHHRIADLIDRIMTGDPWHGSSVRDILQGVTAAQATCKPIPAGHSIADIVLHMTGWAREVTARLNGRAAQEPDAGDWPALSNVEGPNTAMIDELRWRKASETLFEAHHTLAAAGRSLDPARLNDPVLDYRNNALGTGLSIYLTLHGVIHHTVYHAGQIALLKKG